MKRIYRLTVVLFFIMACESEKKQFTKLSHKYTGIDFVNKLYETNTRNYFTYPYMYLGCLLYTSPSPRDATLSRMPSSA